MNYMIKMQVCSQCKMPLRRGKARAAQMSKRVFFSFTLSSQNEE